MAERQVSGEVVRRLYVGGYTRNSSDPGIHAFDVSEDASAIALVGACCGTPDPSFLALGAGRWLYAASEGSDCGRMAAYALSSDGGSPVLDGEAVFSGAAGTCFVLVHPGGSCVYGADYESGSVCACALDEAGRWSVAMPLVFHEGHGAGRALGDPNYDRQRTAHIHTLSFVPGTALVAAVDLGLDAIALYRTDGSGRIVDASGPTEVNRWPDELLSQVVPFEVAAASPTPPADSAETRFVDPFHAADPVRVPVRLERFPSNGSSPSVASFSVRPAALVEAPLYAGPRIIAYHPHAPIAALVCELSCEVVLYRVNRNGLRWQPFARLDLLEGASAAPDLADSGKPPLAAHCEFSDDGRFLYASTRGTNMLTCFALDASGEPGTRSSCSCDGRTPRHFALSSDGRLLAVANRTSDTVTMFRRDAATGKLERAARVRCAAPSCVVWDDAGRRSGWKDFSIS